MQCKRLSAGWALAGAARPFELQDHAARVSCAWWPPPVQTWSAARSGARRWSWTPRSGGTGPRPACGWAWSCQSPSSPPATCERSTRRSRRWARRAGTKPTPATSLVRAPISSALPTHLQRHRKCIARSACRLRGRPTLAGTITGLIVGLTLCIASYSLLYFYSISRAFQHLLRQPYNSFRMANFVLRIQVRPPRLIPAAAAVAVGRAWVAPLPGVGLCANLWVLCWEIPLRVPPLCRYASARWPSPSSSSAWCATPSSASAPAGPMC